MDTTYRFTLDIVREVVNVLNALPAGQVRGLLNRIEQTCVEQDIEHTKTSEMQKE